MFTRGHAQASPSVTLEKGITRLRSVRPAPRLRNVPEDRQHGAPFPSDPERRAAKILATIAFATLLVVCLALYLLSRGPRWELSPLQFLFSSEMASSSPARSELLDPYLTPLPEFRSSEKSTPALDSESRQSPQQYLSYLPHSGFHNQRIALENALVLAYILNRTLLIPPIRLGEPPIRYRPSQSLRVDVALSSEIGLEHCAHASDTTPVPEECTNFLTHHQLPWGWLVDLTPLMQQYDIRMISRPDLTDNFLMRLGVTSTDTYFLNDTAPYQFRLFDQNDDTAPVGPRYTTRVDLPRLTERARTFRLLQFGTLFGTARLRLADPAHATLRRDVRKAMVFANPELLARAKAVCHSEALRGEWGYVAVHLRLGDGVFADQDAPFRNARHVWWRLVRELGVTERDAAMMEALACRGDDSCTHHTREPPPPQSATATRAHPPLPPFVLPPLVPICQEALHPLLHFPLYIATDKPTHPALVLFARTFPCVYFLGNFSQLVDVLVPNTATLALGSASLLAYGRFADPPAKLLAPFLDALIASKARVVVGTNGSTFSRFVEDVLWRQYHGWEIVERG